MRTALATTPFVVVDLETTGGSALFDRVTELAAIRFEHGQVQDRLETLVAPGVPIPPFVTRLTGITDSLVRGKPSLDRLLPDLHRLLDGAVIVAHNASFDCNFLHHAFRRAGLMWHAERLCTLRLARRLVPGLPSYRLDSLCAALGFSSVQRHRAGPDAEATLRVLQHLLPLARERGIDTLEALLALQQQPVSSKRRKGRVDEAQVASLPTGPGVYLLKDHQGHVVYVGKSVNVRQRVRTHLRPSGTAGSPAQPRLRRQLPHVADVEAIETASELEALLLESKLVKRYLPQANSLLRDYQDYAFIKLDLRERYPRLVATRERPADGVLFFGPFRRPGVVASAVEFLSEQLGLRQCVGHLDTPASACALLDMRRCLGPCQRVVAETDYRVAAERAARTLAGQDTSVLQAAAERRDALAEALRFEEAADLRDRMRDLESIIAIQQRLQAFAARNAALISPDRTIGRVRVLLVRAGRLVGDVSLAATATRSHLRHLLCRTYAAAPPPPVSRDELDDVLIMDGWLRRQHGGYQQVDITVEDLEAAIEPLRQAIRAVPQPTPKLPSRRRVAA